MKSLSLNDMHDRWGQLVDEVERTGVPLVLELNGRRCGIILPRPDVEPIIATYATQQRSSVSRQVTTATTAPTRASNGQPNEPLNYLELLRADPTQVPHIDGEPLELMTMMNSGYVQAEQFFQFQHPRTYEMYVYRTSELQAAIGRHFEDVAFIPANPKQFVTQAQATQS